MPHEGPLDPGDLVDGDLRLVLARWHPADAARGWVPWYEFEMHVPDRHASVGTLSLRVGDDEHLRRYAGQVGYAVDPAWRGHRFAARALRLVLPFARRCGLDPVWITCDPENHASIRTLEIVGARRVGIVDLPADSDMYARGERRKVRFRLEAS